MQVKDANRNRRSVGALAATCLVCQLAVAPNVALGNGRANFMLVFAALVALTVGGRTGVWAGFAAGLAFDLATTGPIGLMGFLLTLGAYTLGAEARDRLADDPMGSFAALASCALAVSLAYHLVMLALGQAGSVIDVVLLRTLPTTLLTLVAAVPFVLVLARRGGVGPGGARGRHVGRYSIGGH